jgi:23S rRNA (uracil1939-C5)-methyltransferase
MTETRPAVPDTFSVDVERLTSGPDALAHYEHCVVFVPFAAPGDRAEVAVESRRRGYVRATVTRVLAAGASRVAPFCDVFERCGGCQWQHVASEAQREAKRALVVEQLARLGGLRDVEVHPVRAAASDRGYRARITLAVHERRLGYYRARTHELVEIAACPIATAPVTAHIPAAAAWVASTAPRLTSLAIAEAPRGVVVVGDAVEPPSEAERVAAKAWRQSRPEVQGLVLRSGRQRLVLGDPSIHVPLAPDLHLEVPADAFTQVNPSLNPQLVAAVLERAAVASGATVFDLYCGAGNFALPLARRGADVLAIESVKLAVEAGRANAVRLGLDTVRFERADVTGALARAPRGHLDVAVLDPPRQGAAAALAPLVRHQPARIVYVSCDPATFARDARTLVTQGYRLGDVQPFDLFPHTHHVETVATFQLT